MSYGPYIFDEYKQTLAPAYCYQNQVEAALLKWLLKCSSQHMLENILMDSVGWQGPVTSPSLSSRGSP